jgi:CheY-like chemotaxis protein
VSQGDAALFEDRVILVVDDSPAVRQEVRAFLESNGYGVVEVSDGAEAIRVALEHDTLSAVLCDVNMPGMGGIDFAKAAKGHERLAGLSIVMLTSEVSTKVCSQALKLGAIERPKVVFNATTRQFVMWMHWENGTDYSEARAAVAVSSTIDGPYTYRGSFRPLAATGITDHGKPGYMSRDSNLFVDTDGTAYFISASNENLDLNLYRLSSDYLSIAALVTKLFPGSQREAPVLFKRNGVYILLTSAAAG